MTNLETPKPKSRTRKPDYVTLRIRLFCTHTKPWSRYPRK